MFITPKEVAHKIERNRLLRELLQKGEVTVRVHSSIDAEAVQSMAVLLELKNIFQKQLPKMPKEYVTRLILDMKHQSMVLHSKQEQKVIGGICFRPFYEQGFAEIVFCAVDSDSQIKGYGEFMMNMFKHTIRTKFGLAVKEGNSRIIYLMTYADNHAIGYFRKQGFTKEITFIGWKGRIKDYEGGTLMQGKVLPNIDYANLYDMILARRELLLGVLEKEYPESHKQYVLSPEQQESKIMRPEEIPGLLEGGYQPTDKAVGRESLTELLMYLCAELQKHNAAWPFLEPVDPLIVTDYRSIIKHPMDLGTVKKKILTGIYKAFEEMDADIQLIISNCLIYNPPNTLYAKCAKKLDEFYQEKAKLCRNAFSREHVQH